MDFQEQIDQLGAQKKAKKKNNAEHCKVEVELIKKACEGLSTDLNSNETTNKRTRTKLQKTFKESQTELVHAQQTTWKWKRTEEEREQLEKTRNQQPKGIQPKLHEFVWNHD